jgi:hypothetical protein
MVGKKRGGGGGFMNLTAEICFACDEISEDR